MSEMSLEQQSTLIAEIYRTSSEPEAWNRFLRHIVSVMQGRSARMLVLTSGADTVVSSLKVNIDDDYHQQYVSHYVNECPWRPELVHKQEGFLYSTYLDFSCKQGAYHRSAFYNEWARPQGIEHGLCGTIHRDEYRIVQLLIQRTKEHGYFSRHDQRFVNSLVPHMQQALHMSEQLAALGEDRRLIAEHAGPDRGVLLLDERGRLRYLSSEAERALAGYARLCLQAELKLDQPLLQRRLRLLVQECSQTSAGKNNIAGGVVALTGSSWQLRVMPVCREHLHPLLRYAAAAVAVIVEPRRVRPDFSPREKQLAEYLAAGGSLQGFAEREGIGRETVRSYLKGLFVKTGTHRQHELVALLLRQGVLGMTEVG